ALRGAACSPPTRVRVSPQALHLRTTLVVAVADRLGWPPVDHARDTARLVGGEHGQMVQPTIYARREHGGDRCWDRLPRIGEGDDAGADARAEAHLVDILLLGLDGDGEPRRADHAGTPGGDAERLNGVDQEIAALLLVRVPGQSRASVRRKGGR